MINILIVEGDDMEPTSEQFEAADLAIRIGDHGLVRAFKVPAGSRPDQYAIELVR